jgi:MerR family transcriptional regulator, light-induced transcriptional regulator
MAMMLNIAALSRRTGIAPDTLRKWEQRYGILKPSRTSGGQRRYSEQDVVRVEWLRDRLDEGYRISEAARILGGAETEAAGRPDELPELLLAALADNDSSRLTSLLDQTFTLLPLERAAVDVIAPVLEGVGRGWQAGTISVAQEHLLTGKLRARLDRLAADPHGAIRGTAVLACAPGERHDLGLLMLAVLLGAEGWHVENLGADTPVAQTLALAAAVDADVICISVAGYASAARLRGELADAADADGVPIVIGGSAASDTLAAQVGARYVDGDVAAAARSLREHESWVLP